MATELFSQPDHKVLLFTDLVNGEAVQSNQLLILNSNQSALFDPGGDLTFMPLNMAMAYYSPIKDLTYVFASHQDPDVLSSMDSLFRYTQAKIIVPKVWERFMEHLVPRSVRAQGEDRIVAIPDGGADVPLGSTAIKVLPAHFLHSVGNFHFYDPVSKILFSGDVGASMEQPGDGEVVEDFARHAEKMIGFHRRYMVSNKVCRLWVNMVRKLEVSMIVPQHGKRFEGARMVQAFLRWFEKLECGIDWVDERHYQLP